MNHFSRRSEEKNLFLVTELCGAGDLGRCLDESLVTMIMDILSIYYVKLYIYIIMNIYIYIYIIMIIFSHV